MNFCNISNPLKSISCPTKIDLTDDHFLVVVKVRNLYHQLNKPSIKPVVFIKLILQLRHASVIDTLLETTLFMKSIHVQSISTYGVHIMDSTT